MAFSGVTFSKVEHTISSLPNKPKSHKVFFLCLDITIGKLASICWQITELQNPLLYVCNLSRERCWVYTYMHAIWKKVQKIVRKKYWQDFLIRKKQVSHIICEFSIDGIFAIFCHLLVVAGMLYAMATTIFICIPSNSSFQPKSWLNWNFC